jgi:DNA-binding transcriptional MerR regulator
LKSASKSSPTGQSEPERLYGIAELASEFGLTARAIRFYEAKELLAPPRVKYLDLYGDRGEGRPQQAGFLAERSQALIAELEQKQANIAATLKELREVRRQCLQYLSEGSTPCAGADATDGASNKTRS